MSEIAYFKLLLLYQLTFHSVCIFVVITVQTGDNGVVGIFDNQIVLKVAIQACAKSKNRGQICRDQATLRCADATLDGR